MMSSTVSRAELVPLVCLVGDGLDEAGFEAFAAAIFATSSLQLGSAPARWHPSSMVGEARTCCVDPTTPLAPSAGARAGLSSTTAVKKNALQVATTIKAIRRL